MKIEDFLLRKNRALITVGPNDTIETAVHALSANNIGALVVCDAAGGLVGIISERDVTRGLAEKGCDVRDARVSELMSRNVITCVPGDDVNEIMSTMSTQRIRHIPVLVDGRPAAMISSRDMMEVALEEAKAQRDTLANAYELVR